MYAIKRLGNKFQNIKNDQKYKNGKRYKIPKDLRIPKKYKTIIPNKYQKIPKGIKIYQQI